MTRKAKIGPIGEVIYQEGVELRIMWRGVAGHNSESKYDLRTSAIAFSLKLNLHSFLFLKRGF